MRAGDGYPDRAPPWVRGDGGRACDASAPECRRSRDRVAAEWLRFCGPDWASCRGGAPCGSHPGPGPEAATLLDSGACPLHGLCPELGRCLDDRLATLRGLSETI